MEERNLVKIYWTEGANAGLIIGLTLSLIMILDYVVGLSSISKWIPSILNFVVIMFVVYTHCKRMGRIRGKQLGFTYGRVISFVIIIMMFSGIIQGVTSYIMLNHVDPDHYKALLETELIKSGIEVSKEKMNASLKMMKNPGSLIFGALTGGLFYGSLIGIVMGPFVKIAPKDENQSQN